MCEKERANEVREPL